MRYGETSLRIGQGGSRTHTTVTGQGILSPLDTNTQPVTEKELTTSDEKHSAPDSALSLPNDPDFALVAAAWDDLPDAVRAGILAMVQTAMRTV